MITYEPLWKTMAEKKITTYKLIHNYDIRKSTIDRLKHNENVTIYTLAKLCKILNCRIEDVVEYREDEEESAE